MENLLKKRIKSHASRDVDINKTYENLINNDIYCFLCNEVLMVDICGDITEHAVVDHYHRDSDGKGPIRALLCFRCNTLEGKIRKMIEVDTVPYEDLCSRYGTEFLKRINLLYCRGGGVIPMEVG